MTNWQALLDRRLELSALPRALSEAEKAELKELNESLLKLPKSDKPYQYRGEWIVYHYLFPEQYMATCKHRVLRANSKRQIEGMVDSLIKAEEQQEQQEQEELSWYC